MSPPEPAVQQLLATLSATLGQPVELDASGQCALAFEPDVELVIAHAPDADALSVRAALGDAADLPADALRASLALNYGRLPPGHALGYDEVSRQLALFVLLRASATDSEGFLALLADLVALIPDLRSQLAVAPSAAEALPLAMPPRGAMFA